MKKKLLLIMNPCAGMKTGKRYLADILELFCRADFEPTVFMTTAPGNGRELAMTYAGQADRVICLGGDGTFNEVVSGMLEAGVTVPIGYIPCGSTNDFANSIHLNKNPIKAAQDILDGEPQTLDIGRFGERYFSYVASFGAFTRASYSTPQNVKNALGHLAYILEGIKDLSSIRPYHMRFEVDGQVLEDDYVFGAISNSTSVGGILTLSPDVVDMNDGLFELLLVKNPSSPIELSECVRALQERKYDNHMLTLISAARLEVFGNPNIDWTLDGEREPGAEQVSVENIHNAIRLITGPKSFGKSK